jgi:hypothetical protein
MNWEGEGEIEVISNRAVGYVLRNGKPAQQGRNGQNMEVGNDRKKRDAIHDSNRKITSRILFDRTVVGYSLLNITFNIILSPHDPECHQASKKDKRQSCPTELVKFHESQRRAMACFDDLLYTL